MKLDRMIGILSILLQKEKVTAPYLAEKFEVSRRTINRDIEALCRAGIPLVTERPLKNLLFFRLKFQIHTKNPPVSIILVDFS